jgi:hypothetical protein
VRNDIPEVYLHLAYACSLRDADEEALQFLGRIQLVVQLQPQFLFPIPLFFTALAINHTTDMADFLDPENENAQNLRTSIEAKLEAIEEKKKSTLSFAMCRSCV